MHSSRMRTARSLTVSHRKNHACPPAGATMHAPPEQPRMPPQEQPCMPPQSNHACPPEQPRTPPQSNHTRPPGSNHARSPRSNHACPPCGQTDTCKNITFANFVCGAVKSTGGIGKIYLKIQGILSVLKSGNRR